MKLKLLLSALPVIIIFAALVYFVIRATNTPIAPPPTSTGASVKEYKTLKVDLKQLNNSGINGTANLEDLKGNKTKVKVSLFGQNLPDTTLVYIFAGNCSEIGKLKFPLVSPKKGDSETTLEKTVSEIQSQKPLSIVAIKSLKEIKTHLACGEIN